MKNRNPERRLAAVFAAVFLITALGWGWSSPLSAQQSSVTKRVLVLHWYNREFAWNVEFDQGFKTRLGSAPIGNIEYYQEYLESDRFPGDNQAQLLRDYLRKKYADHPINVVVATSDASLEFLLQDRSSLFPGLPIVFVATQLPTTAELMTEPGLTGIINISTHRRTVDLALGLHPATEQVFVISGTLEHDKRLERLAREELQGYEGRVQITYLTDLSPAQLVQKMESLPKRSIVLYVWEQSKNEQGKLLESVDLFALIAPHAHVPIYGMLLPLIGRGMVGGYVNTGAAAGNKTAEIVSRIETGTRAVDIPVERAPAEPIFDWRELRRWGITENKLPRESVVRFREPTLWEQYKWRILGVAVLLLGQTLLIWGLLIQRHKKRKLYTELQLSDAHLAESKAKLEEAQRITHVGYWEWDISSGRVNWSDETYRIYGMQPQERPMNIAACQERIYPEDWQRGMEVALGGGTRFNAECRVIRPTGEVRIAHFQGDVRRDASGRPCQMFGTAQDITDRKRAEEELRRSQFYLSEGQRLAHTGSWALNLSGSFEYWSQELFKIYGLDPQKGTPTLEQYLATVHPQDRDFIAETVRKMCEQGSGCDVKNRIIRPDGAVRYVRCVGIPVLDNGVLKRLVGTAMDVTEQEQLTQELQSREAYLAEAQSLSHTGSFGWKPDSGEIAWSDETYRIFDYDHAVKPTIDLVVQRIHPEDRALAQEVIDRASQAGNDFEHEYRLLLADGRVKHVHAIAHALQDASGKREFIGAVTDVTETREAEEALRRSEHYLAEAQTLTHMGSWVWQATGRDPVHLSDEWYRIYGFDPKQGMPGWEKRLQRVHAEDRDQWRGTIERAIRERSDYEIEFRILLPDGTLKWIYTVGHPVLNAGGELVQFVGSSMDITESKLAERTLRESEAYLAEAQRLSQTGSWAWSPEQDIRYWSEECYRVLSFDPQKGLPRFEDFFQRLHPDDQPGLREIIQKAVREKTEWEADYRIVHPDGLVRDIHVVAHPVLGSSGHLVEFVGTVIDVTERKRAEEELRRSEFYLAEGQRLGHAGSWALNPSGFFEYWSQELFKIYGLDPQKGAPTLEQYLATVHSQDRDFMAETVTRMCEQASGCDVKKRIIRPDGAVRYVRCVGIPVLENGVLKRFLGTAMDITEQELLNQELELRQADLAEAQKLTHTGSWACRFAAGKMEMRLSEEWYRIYGFDPAEGAPTWEELSERVHPEDRPTWKGAVDRAIGEKADYDLEFRILFPDGKAKWIHAVGHPVLSDTGDLEQFVGSSTDVTERKHAEEALRSSKAYLLEAQRLTHTGSCAIDGTSRETVYWSDEMFRLFGFDPQQGLPTFDQWLQRIHPEDRDKVKLANEGTFITKANCDVEFRILEPDGTVKHIHGIGHPVLSATGELVQILGTMVDVTERKSAEQERERLGQLEADLEHMNRVSTMGEMAASLAHEIKQPITAAVSNAEACLRWLARDQPDMLEMREAATETVKEARRAAEIINRTRSLFQKEVIKREAVDVNEVIDQVASLVRKEAARYSISLRTEFGTGLPKVSANHVQLQQVLINLMLNGIEAMKDAPGELIIKSQRDAQGRLLISVSDTGIGLPAENADKIFNAFFTTKPRGTGMGLAISRSIVESHGGRLWAQANGGRGATFNFTLPHEMVMSA